VGDLLHVFLSGLYDKIIHEVCLQNRRCFCMDARRALGLDGPTHHGLFDMGSTASAEPKHGRHLVPRIGRTGRDMLSRQCIHDGPIATVSARSGPGRQGEGKTGADPDLKAEVLHHGQPGRGVRGSGDEFTVAKQLAKDLETMGYSCAGDQCGSLKAA